MNNSLKRRQEIYRKIRAEKLKKRDRILINCEDFATKEFLEIAITAGFGSIHGTFYTENGTVFDGFEVEFPTPFCMEKFSRWVKLSGLGQKNIDIITLQVFL
jgi:hypothetical protein